MLSAKYKKCRDFENVEEIIIGGVQDFFVTLTISAKTNQ
jgi:hypothetical protein